MSFLQKKSLVTFISAIAIGSYVNAATTVDLVVVIDESGSMSGEHNQFIGSYIQNIDNILIDQQVTLNQYGLVGFGGLSSAAVNEAGRDVGSAIYRHFNLTLAPDSAWGTAAEFNAITPQLETSGSEEDGYRAIEYTYQNFNFRADAGSSILLITDEDRDNDTANLNTSNLPVGQTEIDKAYIQSELSLHNTVLHAVVAQRFTDKSGNPAIAVVGNDSDTGYAYVQDAATGAIIKVQGYVLLPVYDTTQADYTELALGSGGIAMDIDALRSAYTDAATLNVLSSELAALVAEISATQNPVIVGINCSNASGVAASICGAVQTSSNSNLRQLARQIASNNQVNINNQYQKLAQFQMGQMLNSLRMNSRNVSRMTFNRLTQTRRAGVAFNDVDLIGFSNDHVELVNNNLYSEMPTGGAASFSDLDIGLYVRGRYTKGSFDGSDNTGNYDSNTFTLITGGDAFVHESAQVGVALSYAKTDSDFSNHGGDTQIDSLSLSTYGSYEVVEDVFLQASLGFSQADVESKRNNGIESLSGNTNANYTSLSLGAEKENLIIKGFNLTPYAYLHLTNINVDGYSETGGVTALSVKDTDEDSLISELGVYSNFSITDNLLLDVRFSLEHEFKDNGTSVTSSFVASPNSQWSGKTAGNASNYARVGVGLNQNLGSAGIISIWTDALIGDSDYQEFSFEVKYRYVF